MQPADPAAAHGDGLMSVVGSEGQHPFAKVNMNRSTSPLAQNTSPLENWSAVYSVT